MAKERCHLCGQSKGKRLCKIKDRVLICPVCCSKLRSDECWECTYYEASVQYHSEKLVLSMVDSGNLSEGATLMKELYKKFPNYHTVLYGMGVCNALQDRFGEAIEFFKKAVDIFPYFTEAHFNMAMAYIKLGDHIGSVRGFREVIRIGGIKTSFLRQNTGWMIWIKR